MGEFVGKKNPHSRAGVFALLNPIQSWVEGLNMTTRLCSSKAERRSRKARVAGSNPAGGSKFARLMGNKKPQPC